MALRHVDGVGLWLVTAVLVASGALAAQAADLAEMERACEAARQKALAPVRAQRTQACIDQQLRTEDECAHYYSTYGNVAPKPSGAPRAGLFYDLPECREWLEAREAARARQSR